MAFLSPRIRFILAPLLPALLGFSLLTARAEIAAPTPAAAEPSPPSGLCVVAPATSAQDLIARTAGGRVLVHALATDAAAIPALRDAIARAGMAGLVTVAAWDDPKVLPYAENLVDELVIDADALGARAPAAAEIDRVLVPRFGRARVRSGGAWKERSTPMPAQFGEWTHYYYDATSNPVGSDTIGVSNSLRWIAEAQTSGYGYSLAGGGRLLYVVNAQRSGFSGGGKVNRWTLRVRNAFNGIAQWEQTGDPGRLPAQRYGAAIIDGDRFITLRTKDGPLIARSLVDGKEVFVYDQIQVIHAKAPHVEGVTSKDGALDITAILEGRVLYVTTGNLLSAVNADTGTLLWRFAGPEGTYVGFPALDRKTNIIAVGLSPLGMTTARATHFDVRQFSGFDATTGAIRWTTSNPITELTSSFVAYDGGFYAASSGGLGLNTLSFAAFDAATGKIRWQELTLKMGGSGTLMLYPGRAYIGRSMFNAFDLKDGRVLGSYKTGNARCDVPRGSATTINNFGHFFDITNPNQTTWQRREVARNQCGGAALPAYGMRFASDNRCGCFEAIRGQVAFGPERAVVPTTDSPRLLRGPAFARPLDAAASGGWPSFMGDDRRSATGPKLKSDKPVQKWRVNLGTAATAGPVPEDWRRGDQWNGAITPPTVADGRVYVAETSGQRLVCLDAATGKELWSFRAEGRIDGPPRLTRGRAVFGSHDGYVYCLDAKDGALAWRFQAAPAERLITAYSQLESVWPLRGALPVVGDTVLASAGWHPEADGGIALWGLDLASGAIRWKRSVDNKRPEITLPLDGQARQVDTSAIFEPNRVANTVLVADKDVFHLMGLRLNVADGKDAPKDHPGFALMPRWSNVSAPYRRPSQFNLGGPGGWGSGWTLMDAPFRRWTDGKQRHQNEARGRPICVTSDRMVLLGFSISNGGSMELACYTHSAAKDGSAPIWAVKDPHADATGGKAANSMIVAGDRIVSTLSIHDNKEWAAASGHLEIRNLADGSLLHAVPLEVPTVDHGLASADGRLYLSLDNGDVVCWE